MPKQTRPGGSRMDDYYAFNAAFIIGMVVLWFVIAAAGYVLSSLFLMKIFDKAGVQGKWRAWVPLYNMMIFTKLGDLSPWLVLIAIGASAVLGWIPVIGQLIMLSMAVVAAMAAWRVGLKLQKEPVWVVLYVLLSIVWLGIAAYDKSRWNPNIAPAPWANNGFLADRTVWDGVPQQPSAVGAPQQANPGYPQGYQAPGQPGGYPQAPQGYQPPAQQPGGYPQAQPPAQPPVPPAPPANGGTPPVPPTNGGNPPTPPAPPAPPAPGA
ncbi:large exoprotein [Microbacterium sp. YY-01]|uniref:large exoprotein n=1 Tax=Microbacterium sp. YY-01 TaxID=3421634 RepID=UPI003D182B61